MAKISSASIRLVQKLNRMNRNSEFPIYVVVCFHGRVEKSTGVSCLQRDWDIKRECVKKSNSNAAVLNKMLCDIKQRVIQRKNEYELNGKVYTASMLLNEDCVTDYSGRSNIYKDLMDSLIDERRLAFKTRKRYEYSYKKLVGYIGREDFIVDELNVGFIKDFMKALDVADSVKRDICTCIASVWHYAIGKKLVNSEDYPFSEFKYAQRYKEKCRDYFLDKSHVIKLMDYWLDLVIERKGNNWKYREGALERLDKRTSKEFGILWFLLEYKLNGSAPIEIAMLRNDNCRRIEINGESYWAIDFHRQKTKSDVHVRWKRDLFAIIGLEHFLGRSTNGMVYPICKHIYDEVKMNRESWRCSEIAIKHVRDAFDEINLRTIQSNVMNDKHEPLVDVSKVVMYTMRHSLANHLLNSPTVSVRELASILARSPNSISVYIHQLSQDSEIADVSKNMPI